MEQDPQLWSTRIKAANDYYDVWAKKYKVDALEKYYEGFQYADEDSKAYVINLFYSTIEIKIPSLLFQNTIFHVKPKASALVRDSAAAFKQCSNLEDTLNNWITDLDNKFPDEMEQIAYDIWFRFGIVEVGYSANWIENPAIVPPALEGDYTQYSKNPYRKLKTVPKDEKLYIKRILPKTFRVSTSDNSYLERCAWCGYYEYVRLDDLKANKQLKNLDRFEWAGYHTDLVIAEADKDDLKRNLQYATDYCKIWKIWDIRRQVKLIFAESQEQIIFEELYKDFPLVDCRAKKRSQGFYPLPLSFNWVSPQNEQNEIREAHRTHRRRFKRMYQVKAALEQEQKEAMLYGPDGTVVVTPTPIEAIPNADLGQSANITLQTSKDDFNIISGTSSEQRGESDRTTATQAAITNNRSQIRETRERVQFANFLCRVGKKGLEIIQGNFINPYSVQTQNPAEFMGDAQITTEARLVNPLIDLGDSAEFEVNIDVDSLSPLANDDEKKKFLEFIALLSQYPQFSLSPILVQELAFRVGYKNAKVIGEFQRMAQLQMMGAIQQAGGGGQQGGGNALQKQLQPPSGEQVLTQLQNQGIPL